DGIADVLLQSRGPVQTQGHHSPVCAEGDDGIQGQRLIVLVQQAPVENVRGGFRVQRFVELRQHSVKGSASGDMEQYRRFVVLHVADIGSPAVDQTQWIGDPR